MTAKDEFISIKGTTRDDVPAAHRCPPQLLGIVPNNTGGFSSVSEAMAAFYAAEIERLKAVFLAINDWLGVEAVKFRPYAPAPGSQAAGQVVPQRIGAAG